jgi:hypothetical protein
MSFGGSFAIWLGTVVPHSLSINCVPLYFTVCVLLHLLEFNNVKLWIGIVYCKYYS